MTITLKSNPDGVSGAIQVNGVDAVTVDKTGIIQGAPFSFRNKIINGDMRIDQRNAGASVTPAASTYTLDRWRFGCPSARMSVQQNAGGVTPPNGFRNYIGATTTSAYSPAAAEAFTIAQFIEGQNVGDFMLGTSNAKTFTLSFWVRSSLTGIFAGSFSNESGGTRSYPFTYTINDANTWEYKTLTVQGDTSGTWGVGTSAGLGVFFSLGAGSGFAGTAGAWANGDLRTVSGAVSVVGTSGATFYITGVQLEAGTVATPFEHRPYGTELALCQRYYNRLSISDGCRNGSLGWSHENFQCVVHFPEMRNTPSVTHVNYQTNISGTPWATREFQFETKKNTHKFNARYFGANEYFYIGDVLLNAEL